MSIFDVDDGHYNTIKKNEFFEILSKGAKWNGYK